jgi:hypothetical protein
LYASSDITTVIKTGRIRWAEYAASMGDIRNAYKILVGKSEGKDHAEELGISRG